MSYLPFYFGLQAFKLWSVLQLFGSTSSVEILFTPFIQNSFLLLYYSENRTFPPWATFICWLEIYIDSVTNRVAFDTSFLGVHGSLNVMAANVSLGFLSPILLRILVVFPWKDSWKGNSCIVKCLFKACKGSSAWVGFFLKSCKYSWQEKKISLCH